MFDVLVFVYENYWRGDACPDTQHLERKLSAHGFDAGEIQEALVWLDGLTLAAQHTVAAPEAADAMTDAPAQGASEDDAPNRQASTSLRVYSVTEQDHLGAECLGFISFLESSGVLPAAMREIVLDRAMAASGDPVSLDELKIIVLMVYWSFGEQPDALILDELCDDSHGRIAH